MGKRLLRATLLSPLADLDTINGRLDAIEDMLSFPAGMARLAEVRCELAT